MSLVPGNKVDVQVAAKGGGSENKSKFVMLNPSDSLVDWVMKTVPTMGAGWCPPGMIGIGIGGTAEKAMLMAKESLMEPIDMFDLKARGPKNKTEELRIELCDKINALGIGAQGLGGLTTVLDVKIAMYPAHAAGKPVAMIPNCAATRHAHFVLDGSGPVYIDAAEPGYLARRAVGARLQQEPQGRPEHVDARTGRRLETGRHALAQRQDAHRPRRRAQAHPGHAGQGREAAGGLHESRDLLRRPGRPGARRGDGPGRPDDRNADGQVHRDDARRNRADRDDRQGRARPGGDRGDPQAQERLPDGRRRRSLPGGQGDQGSRAWWASPTSAWRRSTNST